MLTRVPSLCLSVGPCMAARILCRVLDRCGSWDCRISDFMCPRHEYNWVSVPYGMTGSCKNAAGRGVRVDWALAAVAVLAVAWWNQRGGAGGS